MNTENLQHIAVIPIHTVVRSCSMVTATCPTTRKEYLQ